MKTKDRHHSPQEKITYTTNKVTEIVTPYEEVGHLELSKRRLLPPRTLGHTVETTSSKLEVPYHVNYTDSNLILSRHRRLFDLYPV